MYAKSCPQIRFSATVLLLITLVTASLGGCSRGLNAIDRHVEALINQQQENMQLPGVAPRSYEPVSKLKQGNDLYDESPATDNPPAEKLHTDPVREMTTDDLTNRLQQYYDQDSDKETLHLTMEDAFRLGMSQGRDYLTAQEEYIIAALRLLMERHRWGPRFFDDISATASGSPSSVGYGTTLDIVNSFRATKRLPYGGEVEARALYNATEDLREQASNEYRQSASLIFSADIPLLRGAGQVAREDLIQQERDLVYAARTFERFRRNYFVNIAREYFSLIAARSAIENQKSQIASLEFQLDATKGKKEAGRASQSDVDNVERNVLSGRDRLVSLKESYALGKDRLKILLGIPIDQPIEIEGIRINIPAVETTVDKAAQAAIRYRLDLQNQRDRVTDSKRAVLTAADQLLPDLDLNASVTFPTNDNSDNISSFALEQALYQAGITLSLPLDREIERAGLRQATIRLMQAERDLQRRQDEIIVDARRAVRDMDRARLSIQLQERNIYITQRRQELLNLREDSDLQLKLDAETDLLRARDARDAAIRDLRIAVLDYLLTTGQMRVTADGMFQPLGGMKLIPDETPENHTQPNNTTNESLENADPGPEENSQVIPGDLEETESGPTVQTEGVNVNENQS